MDPYSPGPGLASSSASAGSPDDQAAGLDSLVGEDNSPTTLASSANSEARAPQSTVSAACLPCRNKHLKCDGKTPCGRCVATESGCMYIPSRRGYKPRRTHASNSNKRHASSSPDATGDSCPMLLGAGTASSIAPFDPAVTLPEGSPFVASQNLAGLQLYRPYGGGGGRDSVNLVLSSSTGGTIPSQLPIPSLDERCLDSFYHNFHAAHPFVLPKEYLLRIAKELNTRHLFAAIRYIGSLFLGGVGPARANYFDEAIRLSNEPSCPKDGFLVQTLLLLIVGLDGSCQQDKARQILGDAERMAISIGLNTRDFATLHGQSIPVWEESWRRTWWDLYVVSGMVAGVHRHSNFQLFDYESNAALPCEEHLYLSGNIPQPMYLEDLEDRDLSGDEREFSSFAYRILAARNLGKFMRTPPMYGPDDENLHRIEALLTNWRMYLPISKRDALNKDCQLDEMMFQAHMITHAVSIMLHQPHSQLDSSPARSVTSCAPHRPVASGESFNTHTQHTFSSASEISKMITHRVPLLSHSHFFTCVVTLSSIVHLSIWSHFFVPLNEDDLRQLIRLNIGALNKLSEVWKAANTASGQVKGVAQEIYRVKKAQQANPAYWVGMTQEEMINSIAADETIMSEIETLQTMPNLLPG